MKIKNIDFELTHEDLVNLFSTALYGSEWLGIYVDDNNEHLRDNGDGDCAEDKWANVLMNGGYVCAYDMESEEPYGDVCESFVDEDNEANYKLTLERIKQGLAQCITGDGLEEDSVEFAFESVMEFIADSGNFDITYADAIMQVCLFGEVIYG